MMASEKIVYFSHICINCKKKVEVIGASTNVWCSCGNKMELISNNYKLLRIAAGLTQKQVAELLGIDKSYISKIEHNVVLPTKEIERRLKDILSKVE